MYLSRVVVSTHNVDARSLPQLRASTPEKAALWPAESVADSEFASMILRNVCGPLFPADAFASRQGCDHASFSQGQHENCDDGKGRHRDPYDHQDLLPPGRRGYAWLVIGIGPGTTAQARRLRTRITSAYISSPIDRIASKG